VIDNLARDMVASAEFVELHVVSVFQWLSWPARACAVGHQIGRRKFVPVARNPVSSW